MGARRQVGGENAGIRSDLVKVLSNSERIPNGHVAMSQARDQDLGRQQQKLATRVVIIKGYLALFEIKTSHFAQ